MKPITAIANILYVVLLFTWVRLTLIIGFDLGLTLAVFWIFCITKKLEHYNEQ